MNYQRELVITEIKENYNIYLQATALRGGSLTFKKKLGKIE
jgi:hypothetical protein